MPKQTKANTLKSKQSKNISIKEKVIKACEKKKKAREKIYAVSPLGDTLDVASAPTTLPTGVLLPSPSPELAAAELGQTG